MLVYKEDTSNVPMIAVLGTWCWMPKILRRKSGVLWIYEDIRGTSGFRKLSTKREIIMFSGRTIARYYGSSWVCEPRQNVESGCSAICGREKLMSLLRKVIIVSHVIQCFLNLLTEIVCRIRVKGFVIGTVTELAHGFVDVLMTVHDYHPREPRI